MLNTQYVTLSMIPSGVMPVLYCSQYDVGRPLGFVVNNGSEVVNLDQYMVAIEGTRSDGTGIVADVNTDGNIGVFLTTATMTNKSDIYDMQLVIRSTDTHRVASIPFMMHVRTAALDENSSVIEEDKSLFQQYTETVMIALAEIRSDVESEATARSNADSALLEKINIEAADRAAEDTALNERINNIIAPGGAPSAAEVTDARLGADGVLYDTLGEAIRTQFENVYKNLAYTVNLESDISGLLVVNGGIGGTVPTSLTAKLEPQQSGAGAPAADNIRPFIQFTSLSMLHAGESGGGGSGNPPTMPFWGGTQNCITGEWTLYQYNSNYSGIADLTGVRWWSDRDVYVPGTNPSVGAYVVYEPTTPMRESGQPWGAEAMYPGINQYKMLAYDSVTHTTVPFALTIEADVANVGDVVDGIAHDVSVLQSDMDQTNHALTLLRNEYDITASTVTVHTTQIENNAEDIAENAQEISLVKSQLEETQPLLTGNLVTGFTDGYVVSAANGNLVATSGWLATDYLTLRPGILYYHSGVSISSFAFYDIGHKFVDLRQNSSVATSNKLNNPFTLPDGIFYGRFCSLSSESAWAAVSAEEHIFTTYSVDGKLLDLSQKAFDGQNAHLAGILKSGKTETLSADMYQHGSLDLNAAGAPLSVYHFSQRIVSLYKEQYPFDVKFTPDSGYGIHYVIFNEDGTITKSGSTFTTNALTVPKYSKFKLSVNAPANATVEDIASHVTISYVADAATDVDGVPTYYFVNNYLPGKIGTIIDKSPLDGLQFAFLTDVHCRENAGNSPELIKYIKSRTNSVPFVVFGGDVLISTVPEGVGVLDDAQTWQTWMEKMDKSHVYQVQGNHDYLGYHYVNSERVGFNEPLGVCRQFVIGNLEDADIVGVPGKLWYYLDIPTAKTRIVFLNDYDTPRNDVAFYGYNGMSVDQVRWVVENALDTDGIRVIFVSHQTYDTEMQGENQNVFVGMQSLFTAIANHTAYSYGAIQKDFTNSTIEFVAHICGHMHADASNVNNGVLTIQSTCDAYYGRSESEGTIDEQAFDIVTVDYTNSKLYTTRIGSGSDREFTI